MLAASRTPLFELSLTTELPLTEDPPPTLVIDELRDVMEPRFPKSDVRMTLVLELVPLLIVRLLCDLVVAVAWTGGVEAVEVVEAVLLRRVGLGVRGLFAWRALNIKW